MYPAIAFKNNAIYHQRLLKKHTKENLVKVTELACPMIDQDFLELS